MQKLVDVMSTIYLPYIYHIFTIYQYIYIYHHISTIGLDDWIERPPWSSSKSGRWASAQYPLTAGWRAFDRTRWLHIWRNHGNSQMFNTFQYHIIPYIRKYANAKTHNPQSVSQWFVGHLFTIKCIHIVDSILAYTSIVSPVATAGARLPFATWSISFIGPNLSGSCHLENQHISSGPASVPLVGPQQSLAAPRTLFKPNGSHLKLSCRPIPITPYDTSWYPMNILIHVSLKNQLQKRSKPFVSCYVTLSHGDPSCTGEVPPSEEFVAGWMAGGYG
jgi:hypothetical protein